MTANSEEPEPEANCVVPAIIESHTHQSPPSGQEDDATININNTDELSLVQLSLLQQQVEQLSNVNRLLQQDNARLLLHQEEHSQQLSLYQNRAIEAKNRESNKSLLAAQLQQDILQLQSQLDVLNQQLALVTQARDTLEQSMDLIKQLSLEKVHAAVQAWRDERALNEERKEKMKSFIEAKAHELAHTQRNVEQVRVELTQSNDALVTVRKKLDDLTLQHQGDQMRIRELAKDNLKLKKNTQQLSLLGDTLETKLHQTTQEREEQKHKRLEARHELMTLLRKLEAEQAQTELFKEALTLSLTPKAVRVQILVCEPIPAPWVEWMDALVPQCGGTAAPYTESFIQRQASNREHPYTEGMTVEDRPSPVQVVVVASASTASTCHDLKSGFMEQRMQDLILAPPYLNKNGTMVENAVNGTRILRTKLKGGPNVLQDLDPFIKGTHADLVSSDPYDLYIALKWSSLLTLRAVSAFVQASADVVAAAASPKNQSPTTIQGEDGSTTEGTFSTSSIPPSPFLIPSFVRVSYISEENNKVAKWRMHGDFFHPAAWEICKDSFDMLWLPHSLAGSTQSSLSEKDGFSPLFLNINNGKKIMANVQVSSPIRGLCYDATFQSRMHNRVLYESNSSSMKEPSLLDSDCGQWWIIMTEEQMPTPPEVYGNERSQPVVQGGSNFFWMITERQRQEIVKQKVCEQEMNLKGQTDAEEMDRQCGPIPQAIIPLGDMESFLINFTPNTALGKKHLHERSPGYSHADERQHDRDIVRERKLLHGQEDIEKALFDYTIYPAALFRKDATLKAVRARDAILTQNIKTTVDGNVIQVGPKVIKSSYYDVTITKPRPPVPGWCQALTRKGLCALYSEYFRESNDTRCIEACGMKKDWSALAVAA